MEVFRFDNVQNFILTKKGNNVQISLSDNGGVYNYCLGDFMNVNIDCFLGIEIVSENETLIIRKK